jgi:hypothetical protein
VLYVYLTRHFGFFQDDFAVIVDRRGWGPDTFLAPFNQHLILTTIAFYKVMFATVGLHTTWPYRLPLFLTHIACVVGMYVLAARRAGRWIALVPAGLLLVLGAGAELELWPIGISSVGALAAGVWALVALDRNDRRGDLWATGLLTLSLTSYSVGLFIWLAIAVQLARTGRRRLWVVAIPGALYAAWYLHYGPSDAVWSNIPRIPGYGAQMAGYGFAGLLGLTSATYEHVLMLGYPALAAAVAWVVAYLFRHRSLPVVALTGIIAAVSFWTSTALARAQFGQPDAERYVYPSAVFILIAAVGFLRWRRVSFRVAALLAAAGALIALLGLEPLRQYSIDRTAADTYERVALGAAEVAGAAGDPNFVPDRHHLSWLTLGSYLKAVRHVGSPAFTLGELEHQSADYQQLADKTLIGAEHVAPRPSRRAPLSPGSCSRLAGAGSAGMLDVSVAPGQSAAVSVASAAPVQILVRRLAPGFTAVPLGTLAPGSTATLAFPRDASAIPWWLRVAVPDASPGGPTRSLATVCLT